MDKIEETKDIFDRLSYIIDKEGLTIASFSREIAIKDQTVRQILTYKKNKPGFEVLKNILERFDWIDARWLMTGKSTEERKVEAPQQMELISIISGQQRTIENLTELLRENKKTNVQERGNVICAAAK